MNKHTIPQLFKQTLTSVGARLSAHRLYQLRAAANYMELGHWVTENGFQIGRRAPDREAVFAAVADRVSNIPVLYLEFGVFEGASMRYWSSALKHPQSILHGFDSFEGLPEDFDANFLKGTLDVKGKFPRINDPRVRFFKGWFNQILPTYKLPKHNQLVVVMDADLYSSTMEVLRYLRPFIQPGTFIYFDDMNRPDHEPRAFKEFMQESGLRFRVVSADYSLTKIFFVCV
jgi:Macrocin-O-methyltransferase (TylF)